MGWDPESHHRPQEHLYCHWTRSGGTLPSPGGSVSRDHHSSVHYWIHSVDKMEETSFLPEMLAQGPAEGSQAWGTWHNHPSALQIRLRCQKGIPPSLRGRAWQYLSGGKVKLQQNPGKFDVSLPPCGPTLPSFLPSILLCFPGRALLHTLS